MSYDAQVYEGARQWEAMATEQHDLDARDASAAHEEARMWKHIQAGKSITYGVTMADSLVNDLGDVIANSDDVMARLITNVAGMRKGDELRGWYAEAIAKEVEALVAKAVEARAFAAVLEESF